MKKPENKPVSAAGMLVLLLVLLNAVALVNGLVHGEGYYKVMMVSFPLLLVISADFVLQEKKKA